MSSSSNDMASNENDFDLSQYAFRPSCAQSQRYYSGEAYFGLHYYNCKEFPCFGSLDRDKVNGKKLTKSLIFKLPKPVVRLFDPCRYLLAEIATGQPYFP